MRRKLSVKNVPEPEAKFVFSLGNTDERRNDGWAGEGHTGSANRR